MLDLPKEFEPLKDYFVSIPNPILNSKTIQIILVREIHDYTILRTEAVRELNTVVTPYSINNNEAVLRVAFLGGKQKASESRELSKILRTAASEYEKEFNFEKLTGQAECYLKGNLCLNCPRCILYGAVRTGGSDPNIKHRIEYSTAYSLLPYEDVEAVITFNAIDDLTMRTEQALGSKYTVMPSIIFPSIVTLRSVTWKEFLLTIKTLLATKSYGAETRTAGDVRNVILGISAGWEEVITPLELTLELYELYKNQNVDTNTINNMLQKYKEYTAFENKVMVVEEKEVQEIISCASKYDLNKEFLEEAFNDVKEFRKKQGSK
ncbi:MAG: type I-D CRISPR-associated protein Cas7/Csc2 [Methanosarcinales archaeon]